MSGDCESDKNEDPVREEKSLERSIVDSDRGVPVEQCCESEVWSNIN